MSSITKHRDKWRAHVFAHGVRATKVFEKRRDAQAWAAAKEKELDAHKKSGGMTFAQGAAKYLSTVTRDKAASALEWEERRFAEAAEFFGENTPLASIDSAKVGEWRDERLQTVKASTFLRGKTPIAHMFQIAVEEWNVLESNPFNKVRMPAHEPPRHQVWTWQLIKRVLRSADDGKRNKREIESIRAFHIALHTAMRLNEILSAKLVGRVAVLERDKNSGKASKPVEIPLPRKGAALFAKYGPFTIKPDIASATFSSLTDELLIDGLTFHDSRASALTWLSRRYDVMTLSRISRHKNLKILMDTYYRETAEQIAKRL